MSEKSAMLRLTPISRIVALKTALSEKWKIVARSALLPILVERRANPDNEPVPATTHASRTGRQYWPLCISIQCPDHSGEAEPSLTFGSGDEGTGADITFFLPLRSLSYEPIRFL